MTVELRYAEVSGVDYEHRLIEMIAVPYESPAQVLYRDEVWNEVFTRGAFSGIDNRQKTVRVNRDHDRGKTVGKAITWDAGRKDGLVTRVRIAKTARGDETLALADEDMLSSSIGFVLQRGSDQALDRSTMTRRINRAFIDHVSFVEAPAYEDAKVLSVRDAGAASHEAQLSKLETPALDELIQYMNSRKS